MTECENRQASTQKLSFICPHCDAYTSHTWYDVYGVKLSAKNLPEIIRTHEDATNAAATISAPSNYSKAQSDDWRIQFVAHFRDQIKADIRIADLSEISNKRADSKIERLFASKCFVCDCVSLWIRDNLVYPQSKSAELPHSDMPESIKQDFEEARAILNFSPRAAAAMLRLAVQKLCSHLGQPGKNIDADIVALVRQGLDQRVQKALDSVRVIGNESVHPGTLDLNDDRETAFELFSLVNFIVEDRIGREKRISGIYSKLPPQKRAAIDERDKKSRT